MYKIMLTAVSTALVFAGSHSVAQQTGFTRAAKIVGCYAITIPADELVLVTPVLDPLSKNATIGDLLGSQLPAGVAHIWDRNRKAYVIAGYDEADEVWAGEGATNVILRGDGFWIAPPKDGISYTITLTGEVPGTYNEAGVTTIPGITGGDFVGYPYPVDILWGDTELANKLPIGSNLYLWESKWITYSKVGFIGWGAAAGIPIKMGCGIFVRPPTNDTNIYNWVEQVPYDL